MTLKPVSLRALAQRDVREAVLWYRREGGANPAQHFVEALEHAYAQLARRPASGSPRYANELNLPGLRCWPIRKFPYLIFYVEHADSLDIWRVLHGQRDLPAWLTHDATPTAP